MEFKIPEYKAPDFTLPKLNDAPDCRFEAADRDGRVRIGAGAV